MAPKSLAVPSHDMGQARETAVIWIRIRRNADPDTGYEISLHADPGSTKSAI